MSYERVDTTDTDTQHATLATVADSDIAAHTTLIDTAALSGKIDTPSIASPAAPDSHAATTTVAAAPASPAPAAGITSFFTSLFSSSTPSDSNMLGGASNSSSAGGVGGGAAGAGSLLSHPEVAGIVSKLKSRRWAATLRPPQMFVGADQFSRPRTTAEAMQRLESNVLYFLTNYLALCALVTIITVLLQPSLIIVGLVLAAMWFFASRQDEIRAGQVVLQGRNKFVALASVSGVVLFLFAGTTLFFVVGLCATIVLLHSVTHNLPPLEGGDMEGDDDLANSDFEPSPA